MRKIIHADMDAFYASVEIRENPNLIGKPVVVGGSPESRAVVCAASYEARKYGIRSAIPCSQAKRLCPTAIFIPPNFTLYRIVSQEIQNIFFEYTDLVEPLSLDEAYLDVTTNKRNISSATMIAEEIKKKVWEKTKLTISCGVSYNKFLAKIASDWKKPNGLFVIKPNLAESFLKDLPIGKFHGVGKVTEKKMNDLGIYTGKDLLNFSLMELERIFGIQGVYYYNIVRGIDNREVNPHRIRKSIGIEDTFPEDISDPVILDQKLMDLSSRLHKRIIDKNISGKTITLKLKFYDFTIKSISRTMPYDLDKEESLLDLGRNLLLNLWNGKDKLRLIGLTLTNLTTEKEEQSYQPGLFDENTI